MTGRSRAPGIAYAAADWPCTAYTGDQMSRLSNEPSGQDADENQPGQPAGIELISDQRVRDIPVSECCEPLWGC